MQEAASILRREGRGVLDLKSHSLWGGTTVKRDVKKVPGHEDRSFTTLGRCLSGALFEPGGCHSLCEFRKGKGVYSRTPAAKGCV